MTVTALMVFIVISQLCVAGYLLYSFNDVEREARKRNADLRAHMDAVIADLESRLRDTTALREPVAAPPAAAPLKRAVG
jgi:hypothetical protein